MLQSVRNSILFLALARNTICEMVEKNLDENISTKTELTNYIQNEASDYEIIHLLATNNMPEEKYDIVDEEIAWQAFRHQIVQDFSTLSENIEPSILDEVVFNLGSVTSLSLSSASPLREARADRDRSRRRRGTDGGARRPGLRRADRPQG